MSPLLDNKTVTRGVIATAQSSKKFSPRFVARTLGVPVADVIATCKRAEGEGLLRQVPGCGELYYAFVSPPTLTT